MRIINGGVKMKRAMKTSKLLRYECEKCNKLWGLIPEHTVHTGTPIFCGYVDGRKKWRTEGYCHCGTPFNHPFITVSKLKENYGRAWAQNQDGE